MNGIREAGLKLILLGGALWSGPLVAGEKLPTRSCQDRDNLLIFRTCDPYSVHLLSVDQRQLRVRTKQRRIPTAKKRGISPFSGGSSGGLGFQRLVEKYIDYEEAMLRQRRMPRPKNGEYISKKEHLEKRMSRTPEGSGKSVSSTQKGAETGPSSPLPTLADYLGDRDMEAMLMPLEYRNDTYPREFLPVQTPPQPNPPAVPTKPRSIRVTVAPGETLGKLARRYRTTVYDIRRWNRLKRNHLLKAGEHLTIRPGVRTPPEQIREALRREKFGYYRVEKGDTLIGIARRFGVKKREIAELNDLKKRAHLRIGQKLMLPMTQKKIDTLLKKERRFKYASNGRFRHKLRVVATAYTSHRSQTDRTPFLAAWNNRIRPGMKIIAVSPDLIRRYGITNGTKVRISGLPGIYTVRDKMHHRMRRHIDIYMGTNRRRALRWGRRRVILYW